jgi:hypothetical protein
MRQSAIAVVDGGEVLEFPWSSLYAYCGPTQIIASALMFRLFIRAFRDLSPGGPPDRESLWFLSGFPGTGIAECVELVTRIRSRHPERFSVDPGICPPEAPATGSGFLYFEVQVGGRRAGYWPPRTVFDDTFRENVGRYQNGSGTREEQAEYLRYKRGIADTVLGYSEDSLFSSRPAAPV